MKLTSFERGRLAYYIMQSKEEREKIMERVLADPATSGPLIQAYRCIEEVL